MHLKKEANFATAWINIFESVRVLGLGVQVITCSEVTDMTFERIRHHADHQAIQQVVIPFHDQRDDILKSGLRLDDGSFQHGSLDADASEIRLSTNHNACTDQ